MQEIRRLYNKNRDMQIRYLRKNQIPRTGLMDIERLRRERLPMNWNYQFG